MGKYRAGLAVLFAAFACASGYSAPSSVVISQVYGGGGNQGATYTNDFIELFNRGTEAADLSGWTVQYASASGSSWEATPLTGRIEPGQYFLVGEQKGAEGTLDLPAPDSTGNIGLSAASGKVALVRDLTLLSGSSPTSALIADLVGYGSASYSKGSPAPALTNTTAILRQDAGCTDTGDNSADFFTGPPAPRNGSTPFHTCSVSPPTQTPAISAEGVVNAASYAGGAVAPGEIVAIFGENLGPSSLVSMELTADGQYAKTSVGGTRVLFDGVAAPMVYSSAGQISTVVPFSVAGKPATTIQVEHDGLLSNAVSMPVAPRCPAYLRSIHWVAARRPP